jgi:hypothetical protein
VIDLRRFWIELEAEPQLPIGFGVTAVDVDDALRLISEAFAVDRPLTVGVVREDVNVGEIADWLEKRIPRPRLGVPIGRGIWFPNVSGP